MTRSPKRRCKRGHLLSRVGWVVQPCSRVSRQAGYTGRRCKACLREDVAKHKRGKVRNERTSKRVAKIAAGILALKKPASECCVWTDGGKAVWIMWSDIRALAASCLTQAADKKSSPQIAAFSAVAEAIAGAKRKRRARRK